MSFKLHSVFMQIRCNFPDISYLSETQKNNFQFLSEALLCRMTAFLFLQRHSKFHEILPETIALFSSLIFETRSRMMSIMLVLTPSTSRESSGPEVIKLFSCSTQDRTQGA